MSIPSDLLDQLLTGYLDNALSPDERARVDSLLQSDPKVAADLAELRQLQKSLRSVAQADSSIQLDAGFADRVLGAAVDRARTEGLAEDHPLVRLADQPSISPSSSSQSFQYRYAAILVGLAASIAIAVLVLRPGQIHGDPNQDSVAMTEAPAEVVEATETNDAADDSMIASDPASAAPAIVSVEPEGRGDDRRQEPESVVDTDETPAPTRTAIAKATMPDQPAARTKISQAAKQPAQQPTIQLGAILVLDVRLTVAGRMEDAISASMQAAGLEPANEKKLPSDLVGALGDQENDTAFDDEVAVMYLQASAKTLDRFYLSLMSDQDGIDTVGMSLAMNAPILKIVESILPDPTTVRHDSTSLELAGDQSIVKRLAGELDQLQFAPLNRETAGAMSPSGPDVPSQILLLIR
jgi:hypothetical protein